MNETRIPVLRQERGWTQERLAAESGVGIRTVQRLEAGHDASLETLSLVAGALQVSVRDLFTILEGQDFATRVQSLEDRAETQQAARDRITRAWQLLYIGVGIVVTLFAFTSAPYGLALIASYWAGGLLILKALRTLVLEPRLDEQYPLSHRRTKPTKQRTQADPTPLTQEQLDANK